MGDTLFGGVESGTPLETRGGTEALASLYRGVLAGNDAGLTSAMRPFQRLGAQSFQSLFGLSPGAAGVPEAVQSMLTDPGDRMRGLFAAMRPFENRQVNEAVAGTRSQFGTAGGRFSRNLADRESQVRGELANQFARTRQEGLLSAQAQQGQFLSQLFNLANQQSQLGLQGLSQINQFLAPGAPVHTEGILPGLIGAAGNIFAATQLGGFGGGGLPSGPLNPGAGIPAPSDPFGPGGPYYRRSY